MPRRARNIILPDDVPADWFTWEPDVPDDFVGVVEFEDEEPTHWIPAETEAPDAVYRWKELFKETVRFLGGVSDNLDQQVEFQVSTDGKPRQLRTLIRAEERGWHTLWADRDLDLSIEFYALEEWWDQRFPHLRVKDDGEIWPDDEDEGSDDEPLDLLPVRFQRLQELGVPIEDLIRSGGAGDPVIGEIKIPSDEEGDPIAAERVSELFEEMMETDEYGWIGSRRHEYQPLAALYPALVDSLLDRYAALFVRFGRFQLNRTREARDSLVLTVPVDASQDVIRCSSHFTGETR